MSKTNFARSLKDSQLFAAAKEAQGYLSNRYLDADIAESYRKTLREIEGEIARREI